MYLFFLQSLFACHPSHLDFFFFWEYATLNFLNETILKICSCLLVTNSSPIQFYLELISGLSHNPFALKVPFYFWEWMCIHLNSFNHHFKSSIRGDNSLCFPFAPFISIFHLCTPFWNHNNILDYFKRIR